MATLLVVGVVSTGAQASFRTLIITTEPDAIVWVDDVRHGTTGDDGKITIKTISPGAHSIRVRANGFKELTKTITAAQKGDISIPLTKTTDEAEISYQQAEALTLTDREKAIEAYRKAIRLRPRYPEAYLGLARVYSDMGDAENALKAIRDARRLRPVYAEASAVEGRILKDSGEETKAIAAFNRSLKEAKNSQPEANTGLGLLYKDKAEASASTTDFDGEAENYALSAKHLQSAVKQLSGAPDAIVVYQILGLVYEKQRKYKEAIGVYREFLKVFPDSNEATAVESYIVQIEKQMREPK
ncbi:MAG TPA: tetratricopeptide repeat protein [Pyrinomonadaceae bacterium]|nr:tetratricopeptide repeat protein [Pyrinomonadaceae bacterium]